MNNLSDEERRLLLHVGDAGLVAFKPRRGTVIARLLDLRLMNAERVDDETALLRHTSEGHTLVARLRDNMS